MPLRVLLSCLIVLFFGACAPLVAPRASPAVEVGPDVLSARSVALVADRLDTGYYSSYCSGVWLSYRVIVTAGHCMHEGEIGDPYGYVVKGDVFPDGGAEAAELKGARLARLALLDEDHDLAILVATNPPPHDSAKLGDAYQGQPVQTIGHPAGLWFSYSSGVVAAVRKEIIGLDIVWVQSTAQISPGNSGGGLFDLEGNLLGVCSRGYTGRAQGLNFWVHSHYVSDAIAKLGLAGKDGGA